MTAAAVGFDGRRLVVRVGDITASLPARAVAEVMRRPSLTRVPHGPDGLMGVTSLRGAVLPVLALGRLLGVCAGAPQRVLVLQRDPPVGLAVDGVEMPADDEAGQEPGDDGRLRLRLDGGGEPLDLDAALAERFAAGGGRRHPADDHARARSAAAPGDERAFLRLDLSGQAFGVPLEAVDAVAAAPNDLPAQPQGDALLLGEIDHRGGALPVVSGRRWLGLPETTPPGRQRLVVLKRGQERLGLTVDGASMIVRAPADRLARAPSLFSRSDGAAVLDTVLRLADGRGVMPVLATGASAADARAGAWRAPVDAGERPAPDADVRRERIVVLRLGEERYGLPIGAVEEVLRAPDQLTRLPGGPDYLRGVMNLRGRTLAVIDQALRLGIQGSGRAPGRIVVVTVGGLQAGLAVDAVEAVIEVGPADLTPAPELCDGKARLFDRAVRRGGEIVLLIDPSVLLERTEADLLRDLAPAGAA